MSSMHILTQQTLDQKKAPFGPSGSPLPLTHRLLASEYIYGTKASTD